MKFASVDIVFEDVPDEISLSYLVSGCPLNCKGCHSAYARNLECGNDLNTDTLKKHLEKYKDMVSCVLFYGGEWHKDKLLCLLKFVKRLGLKTCLYTGLAIENISQDMISELDYIKYGSYIERLGGLESKSTNQVFLDIKKNKKLNYLFNHE